MSDPEIDALVREARAQEAALELGPCGICGSTQSLVATEGGTRCYEHRLGPDALVEVDHPAGVANLPGFRVRIRANAHRRATELRLALGEGRWRKAHGDPLLQMAHLLAGLLSYLWLLVEWVLALDAYLRELIGESWFGDAPPFPFA
jgi:hypothetical protein